MTTFDAIVIGGGLHGCSTALQLAMRGVKACVVEKDHVARHASGVNAGGVRRLGRHVAEIPLSVASMEMWHAIRDLVDDDCGFESHGQVKVAESEAELETLRARVALVRDLGFDHEELIGHVELRDVLPAVSEHCVGAIICRRDGAALPFRTTQAFKRKAEALGAVFREGERVASLLRRDSVWHVTTDKGSMDAPIVVNCAGAWAGQIAAAVGEPVPIEPVALMLMISAPQPRFLLPVVGATSRPLSFKQYANGTVLIGGGYQGRAFPDENRTEIDFTRLAASAQTVCDLFPVMRGADIVRTWAGIEGRMPDDIPVIGPSSVNEGLFHAFGFSAHGFQLGPVVGALTAELITTGRTNLPIAPFAISRFKTGQASRSEASAA